MSCANLPPEHLIAYLDGELATSDATRVAAHLADCAGCAAEAELLAVAGDAVAALPRHDPGPDFSARVTAAAASESASAPASVASPRARLLRMWPAAAAAAALVAAIAARTMLDGDTAPDAVLTAAEERDIAADLYVLTNLDTLENVEPDELIALVEELDLLEGLEPEMSGLYEAADTDEDGG